MSRLRMYILVKESISVGHALVATAHASFAGYLRFKDTPEVVEWIAGPFYKTICKVSDAEFENAKTCPDHVVLTESSLDNAEVALAFKLRVEWPKSFRFLWLYRGA